MVASHTSVTVDLAYNPGMCHDWESNWRPFSSQASTQSTESHQPGRVRKISLKITVAVHYFLIIYVEVFLLEFEGNSELYIINLYSLLTVDEKII